MIKHGITDIDSKQHKHTDLNQYKIDCITQIVGMDIMDTFDNYYTAVDEYY